jgi:ADP-ribose pyrophosphatase YjhB (NUDIX family)/ribosomal protein S18 acetylase RimI-like enzyme
MNEPTPTYCRRCGAAMGEALVGGRTRLMCPDCGFVLFQNPVPGAGVLVEMDEGVVLIRRGHPPNEGRWALPAGFIEADESIEEAAIRECKEETGLDVELLELFGVDSFPEGPVQSGIIVFYRAKPLGGELRPGDDAAETAVFPPEALPADIAFRTHRTVLARWAGLRGVEAPFVAPKDEFYPLAPKIFIRKARPDDETSVLRLLPLIPANANLSEQELQDAQLRMRESTALDVLVAEADGEVVGFLVLSFVPALTGLRAWIDDVAVDPSRRRQGIGRALVEAAMQRASRRGATHLYMDTSRGNPDAKEFYRACGFEEEGVAPLHIR